MNGNLYLYVMNNPINYIDPNGNDPISPKPVPPTPPKPVPPKPVLPVDNQDPCGCIGKMRDDIYDCDEKWDKCRKIWSNDACMLGFKQCEESARLQVSICEDKCNKPTPIEGNPPYCGNYPDPCGCLGYFNSNLEDCRKKFNTSNELVKCIKNALTNLKNCMKKPCD